MASLALLLVSGGCGVTSDPPPPGEVVDGELDWEAFAGLEEDASWTWRDDESEAEDVDGDQVVRGRHVGDGEVELRRGARWADAESLGHFAWRVDEGLGLSSWLYDDTEGTSSVLLLSPETGWSGVLEDGDWRCETSGNVAVDSWYGLFEDGLEITCTGDAGLPGSYYFARDRGLVGFVGEDFQLDLVSPFG